MQTFRLNRKLYLTKFTKLSKCIKESLLNIKTKNRRMGLTVRLFHLRNIDLNQRLCDSEERIQAAFDYRIAFFYAVYLRKEYSRSLASYGSLNSLPATAPSSPAFVRAYRSEVGFAVHPPSEAGLKKQIHPPLRDFYFKTLNLW